MPNLRTPAAVALAAALLALSGWAQEPETKGADDEPPAHANTLKWTTASEVDNFGYDVYRGESEEGPFERITETPILGAGTTDEPQSYRWVDRTIDPTKAYYYYVESIDLSGHRERFTPIHRAAPKIATEEGEAGDGEGKRPEEDGSGAH